MSEQGNQGQRFFDNGCLTGFAAGLDDATLRYTQGGTAYLRFSIPISERKRDGNQNGATVWVSVVAFGKVAEDLASWIESGMVRKGTLLRVQGKFEAQEYNGNTSLSLVASEISVLAKERNLQGGGGGRSSQPEDIF